jgi:hypothetical protein
MIPTGRRADALASNPADWRVDVAKKCRYMTLSKRADLGVER